MAWCDVRVAKLFELRYKSPLTPKFDSKNNSQKKLAYQLLASELSVTMHRTYTSKQIQDKVLHTRQFFRATIVINTGICVVFAYALRVVHVKANLAACNR